MSNVAFTSLFHFDKIGRKHIEEKTDNPEYDLENLTQEHKHLKPFFFHPNEALGKSQIRQINQLKPIEMSDEDLALLRSLNSDKYGFSPDGREFWVHSKKKKEDGTYSFITGDGKLQEGQDKKEFIKDIIGDDAQGFNVTGKGHDGDPVSMAIVYNKNTKETTLYSTKYSDGEACLEYIGEDGFREAILDSLKELKTIYGATVWK